MSTPLWYEIYDDLSKKINSKQYPPNYKLPGESELAKEYYVSRITVRAALNRLTQEELIKRIKGNGTYVLDKKIKEPLLKINSFTDDMKKENLIPSISEANIYEIKCPLYIAKMFGISPKKNIVVLERVRCINNVKIGYFKTYFNPCVKLEEDNSLYYDSLYEMLKSKNYEIDSISQTIGASLCDKEVENKLGMKKDEPILVLKRVGYSNEKMIEYSVCKYDAKRYEYNMELNK